MKPLSIMIKPASSECNLDCRYCFYHSLCACRTAPSHGMMSESTLKEVLTKAFTFTGGAPLSLSFQGGEPLLRGKEFFITLGKLISELNVHKSPVFVGVQTNGTLIDEEWCRIFKEGGYLVGISLDGDREANALRVDYGGKESFDKVVKAIDLMNKYGVDYNILSVLTKPVARRIKEVYAFFKEKGFRFLQFIPCLKPLVLDEKGNVVPTPDYTAAREDYYLSAEDYSYFLRECFNLYFQDFVSGNYISIRQFDNFVKLAHFEAAEQCGMNGHCAHQFVIEGDGEVYPCDFYCLDNYSLGKIQDSDFNKLSAHPKAVAFIKESMILPKKCQTCPYFALCRNGCKRERIDIDKCEAYRKFFSANLSKMQRMS